MSRKSKKIKRSAVSSGGYLLKLFGFKKRLKSPIPRESIGNTLMVDGVNYRITEHAGNASFDYGDVTLKIDKAKHNFMQKGYDVAMEIRNRNLFLSSLNVNTMNSFKVRNPLVRSHRFVTAAGATKPFDPYTGRIKNKEDLFRGGYVEMRNSKPVVFTAPAHYNSSESAGIFQIRYDYQGQGIKVDFTGEIIIADQFITDYKNGKPSPFEESWYFKKLFHMRFYRGVLIEVYDVSGFAKCTKKFLFRDTECYYKGWMVVPKNNKRVIITLMECIEKLDIPLEEVPYVNWENCKATGGGGEE